MLMLNVRHIELFLCEWFWNGTWDYDLIGSCARTVRMLDASGAIFDLRHLNDPASIDIFNSLCGLEDPIYWNQWAEKLPMQLQFISIQDHVEISSVVYRVLEAQILGSQWVKPVTIQLQSIAIQQ